MSKGKDLKGADDGIKLIKMCRDAGWGEAKIQRSVLWVAVSVLLNWSNGQYVAEDKAVEHSNRFAFKQLAMLVAGVLSDGSFLNLGGNKNP